MKKKVVKKIVKLTSRYINEFNSVSSKKEFITLLLKKYPKLKKETAIRRYYDCKKIVLQNISVKPLIWKYSMKEKEKPHPLKLIMIKDMIRFNMKINREYLQQHGFNNMEINWLVDEGLITLDEKIL